MTTQFRVVPAVEQHLFLRLRQLRLLRRTSQQVLASRKAGDAQRQTHRLVVERIDAVLIDARGVELAAYRDQYGAASQRLFDIAHAATRQGVAWAEGVTP